MNDKKKYEEAERLYQTANADQRYVLESLFPKLRESEDEKIREYLIKYIDNTMKSSELKSKLLAWLEKQNEQSPNDGPAWSDGDDVLLSSIINSLLIFEDSGASKMKIDWLKHIRNRIKGE